MRLHFRAAGPPDAPVVLLLHGFPSSSVQYRHLMPALADRWRLIAPDLPGFGASPVPARATFDGLADAAVPTMGADDAASAMCFLLLPPLGDLPRRRREPGRSGGR